MLAVVGATTCVGGHRSEERGIGNAEANFFAFHVAARLRRGGLLINSAKKWIAFGLGPVGSRDSADEEDSHCSPDRPAVALRAGHASERIGECGGNCED